MSRIKDVHFEIKVTLSGLDAKGRRIQLMQGQDTNVSLPVPSGVFDEQREAWGEIVTQVAAQLSQRLAPSMKDLVVSWLYEKAKEGKSGGEKKA